MKTWTLHFIERLRASFWVLPLCCLLAAITLAFGTIFIDNHLFSGENVVPIWFLLHFNEQANISSLLTTVASSVLGVAGVTFSITIASLTLASQQFGPRLLRNFMRNRFNQIVIGVFTATFLYCILILQFTSSMDELQFRPILSMLTVLSLVIVDLLVLVFFIHHVAVSIQADTVIAEVYHELQYNLELMFPQQLEDNDAVPVASHDEDLQQRFDQDGDALRARSSGYLQAINISGLKSLAESQAVSIRLDKRAGEFIMQGGLLGRVLCSQDQDNHSEIDKAVNECLIIGNTRTSEQDAEYAVRQLVEVALRALSPGINDPFTAIACINRLGNALLFLGGRQFPLARHYDDEARLRLQLKPFTYSGVIDSAFDQIRQNATAHPAVIGALLNVLRDLAEQVRSPEQARAIYAQAAAIRGGCNGRIAVDADDRLITSQFEQVRSLLKQTGHWQAPTSD